MVVPSAAVRIVRCNSCRYATKEVSHEDTKARRTSSSTALVTANVTTQPAPTDVADLVTVAQLRQRDKGTVYDISIKDATRELFITNIETGKAAAFPLANLVNFSRQHTGIDEKEVAK